MKVVMINGSPHKNGSTAAARRGGTTIALAVLNQYALVGEQPVIPSCYWCTAARRRKCAPMQRGCASPIRWASAWRNTFKGSAKDKAGARTFSSALLLRFIKLTARS